MHSRTSTISSINETQLVQKLLKLLRERGAFAEKIHGSSFQPRTIDIIACLDGHFIGIEAKVGNNKPTPRQEYTLNEIVKAGGYAWTIYSRKELDNALYLFPHACRYCRVEITREHNLCKSCQTRLETE